MATIEETLEGKQDYDPCDMPLVLTLTPDPSVRPYWVNAAVALKQIAEIAEGAGFGVEIS